ncbi:hypothetical protein NE237_004187 [Protea cynaroides]|uniref:HMG box domain-containing protein n=1 Tax=Protea cynaroides TaxID=273540 RepID=A0A9Q0KI73_9MAGN|nr:hypothetical protein NE237_004187 [Protea cynaroides]
MEPRSQLVLPMWLFAAHDKSVLQVRALTPKWSLDNSMMPDNSQKLLQIASLSCPTVFNRSSHHNMTWAAAMRNLERNCRSSSYSGCTRGSFRTMKSAKGKGAVKKDTKAVKKDTKEALKAVDDRKVGKRKAAAKVEKGSKGRVIEEKAATEDPDKPKRPPSAFFVFMEEFRKSYKLEHPNVKSVSAVGKAGGEKWKSLSVAEKAPYEAKGAKRDAEYEKHMSAYIKEQESTTDDGNEESDRSRSEMHDDDDDDDDDDGDDDEEESAEACIFQVITSDFSSKVSCEGHKGSEEGPKEALKAVDDRLISLCLCSLTSWLSIGCFCFPLLSSNMVLEIG